MRTLDARWDGNAVAGSAVPYRLMVASRVSERINADGAADRKADGGAPWAMPELTATKTDESLQGSLYRSADAEAQGIIAQIRRRRFDDPRLRWNDMAVVSEDNATVRRIGEALRRDGIPVRFSSVTKPFAGDPLVEGLLSLMKLGFMRMGRYDYGEDRPLSFDEDGSDEPKKTAVDEAMKARCIKSTLLTFASSPLVGVPTGRTIGTAPITRPLRLHSVTTAVGAAALAQSFGQAAGQSALEPKTARENAAYASLVEGGEAAGDIVARMKAIDGGKDVETFCATLSWIDDVVKALKWEKRTVSSVLWATWCACVIPGVMDIQRYEAKKRRDEMRGRRGDAEDKGPQPYRLSDAWCEIAVGEGQDSDVANDWLDTAIRLFRFAEANGEETSFPDFMKRVHNTEVVADTLAKKELQADAVTVTTTTGAIGRQWRHVWVPGVQQGVWPRDEEGGTPFGLERLADALIPDADGGGSARTLLRKGEGSLLVALTRATEGTTVSCVWNEDETPSEFLRAFLPERFPTDGSPSGSFADGGDDGDPVEVRGTVARARINICCGEDTTDAARTLSYLAGLPDEDVDALPCRVQDDVRRAAPENWAFANPCGNAIAGSDGDGVIALRPSEVDALWSCPICGMLDRELSGPTEGNAGMLFGNLIHNVARQTSDEIWKDPQCPELKEKDDDKRAAAILAHLKNVYDAQSRIDDGSMSPSDRFAARRNERDAGTILENIARYFAEQGNADDVVVSKKDKNTKPAVIRMGPLTNVETEKPVYAEFSAEDMASALTAATGEETTGEEMLALLSALAGGFPDGLGPRTKIGISARIDRLETRGKEGEEIHRIIDYKTGTTQHKRVAAFNDLQLICYQLALHFGEARLDVENADIFDVRFFPHPGSKKIPELYAQPSLFPCGRLTAREFRPRSGLPEGIAAYTKDLPQPQGLKGMAGIPDWMSAYFMNHPDTTTYWALGQIAKVFYAAAVVNADAIAIPARQPQCGPHCRHKNLCPACAMRFKKSTGTIMGESE